MTMTLRSTAVALLLAAPAFAATESFVVDKAHSEVSFQVAHLGISKVRGQFTDFEANLQIDRAKPEASSVEFTIQAGSINTGVADRDKHLRSADFLDAEKQPTITFKSTRVVPKGKNQFDVVGSLTIRGVTKEVTLPVTATDFIKDPWGNEKVGFELSTKVNRKDYGVSWHKVMDSGGLVAGDEVSISINLETAKKK
jgi:polyisoprenoid-binding protein YceI